MILQNMKSYMLKVEGLNSIKRWKVAWSILFTVIQSILLQPEFDPRPASTLYVNIMLSELAMFDFCGQVHHYHQFLYTLFYCKIYKLCLKGKKGLEESSFQNIESSIISITGYGWVISKTRIAGNILFSV